MRVGAAKGIGEKHLRKALLLRAKVSKYAYKGHQVCIVAEMCLYPPMIQRADNRIAFLRIREEQVSGKY